MITIERNQVRKLLKECYGQKEELNTRVAEYAEACNAISAFSETPSAKRFELNVQPSEAWQTYCKGLKMQIDKIIAKRNLFETLVEDLDADERRVIYFRYFQNIPWIDLEEHVFYAQRTCQNIECRALEKIAKKISSDKTMLELLDIAS